MSSAFFVLGEGFRIGTESVNLPNYLTLLRIIIVPLLVVVLLTNVAESYIGVSGYAFAIVIFLLASFTDILD